MQQIHESNFERRLQEKLPRGGATAKDKTKKNRKWLSLLNANILKQIMRHRRKYPEKYVLKQT